LFCTNSQPAQTAPVLPVTYRAPVLPVTNGKRNSLTDSTRSPQPSSAAPAKEGEAPSQEQQAPPSSAHQEEEEERSDKGEDESGWNDDEDWEGLEVGGRYSVKVVLNFGSCCLLR